MRRIFRRASCHVPASGSFRVMWLRRLGTELKNRQQNLLPPLNTVICKRLLSTKCHYDVMGVSSSASKTEIKAAYLQLAKQLHPDICETPGAESRFKEITAAFDVLGSSVSRAAYDHDLLSEAQGFHYSPEPYRSPHGASRNRFAAAFSSLGPATMAIMFVVMPLVGLVVMGFSTFQEKEPTSDLRFRGRSAFTPAGGGSSGERRVACCFNRRTGMWEEYDFHSMHKFRGQKVQYISREKLNAQKREDDG